ncbi:MAG: T9SS type A sorting domain-containing protein [Balneolaceae bacterium]
MKTLINLSLITLMLSATGYAQEKINKDYKLIEEQPSVIHSTSSYLLKSTDLILSPAFTIGGTEYPNPERNFVPSENLSYAGDINNDGYDDFYYKVTTGDESTEDLSDQTTKMMIFYGSDTGITETNSLFLVDDLIFLTDLNDDGFTDPIKYKDGVLSVVINASEGDFDNLVQIDILSSTSGLQFQTNGDFDGDGYNDFIAYRNYSPGEDDEIYMIYGAESVEDLTIETLDIQAGANAYKRLAYNDVDGDGNSEIVSISSFQSSVDEKGAISVFQLTEGELQLLARDTLNTEKIFNQNDVTNFSSLGLADLNGDGNMELLFNNYYNRNFFVFDLSDNEGEYYSDETLLEMYSGVNEFSILGDFNNDGNKNVLIAGNERVDVITADEQLELNIEHLPLEEGDWMNFLYNPTSNINGGGDVNGDGIDDIVIEFSNAENRIYGYRVYFGNKDGNFGVRDELVYSRDDYISDIPTSTFNAGDLNGDGIDDYGITYLNEVEVFYGGNFGDNPSPDVSISSESRISAVASGDFNNDGYSDIALNHRLKGIEIYFGGASMDGNSDYTLLFEDQFPEYENNSSSFEALANAGDLNEDGIDDLIFSTFHIMEDSYVLFGGETLSVEPDLEIPFYATNFMPVGDFNNNGNDEIAVGNVLTGTVNLYSSFDEAGGDNFNIDPVLTISEKSNEERVIAFFGIGMTAGDFDGDGSPDLVISPYIHRDASDPLIGVDAFYIYLGGEEANSVADHSFGIDLNTYANNGLRSTIEGEFSTMASSSIGELTTVPDQNGDGADELLFATLPGNFGTNGLTNAGVYYGNSNISEMGSEINILLEAPNKQLGLGSHNNNIYSQNNHSAVGDFDDDGKNDLILLQSSEFNFIKDPIYIYNSDEFSVDKEKEIIEMKDFRLNQNFPNPFNPTTKISYNLPTSGDVKLEVFDITGRLVSTLISQSQIAGNYTLSFDASAFSSGIYIYRLKASGFVQTRKMTLIK